MVFCVPQQTHTDILIQICAALPEPASAQKLPGLSPVQRRKEF